VGRRGGGRAGRRALAAAAAARGGGDAAVGDGPQGDAQHHNQGAAPGVSSRTRQRGVGDAARGSARHIRCQTRSSQPATPAHLRVAGEGL